MTRCSLCERPLFAAGLCGPHYKRQWRHGDPHAGGLFNDATPAEVIERSTVTDDEGCWVWQLSTDNMGYGTISRNGKTQRAHRWVYEAFRGPIASGLELDHLCRNKPCVNPDHLDPVTHSENLKRHYSKVTACPRGHHYTTENTYLDHGRRRCRTCMREQQRRRRARNRGTAA